MGAIGAALHAMDEMKSTVADGKTVKSRFRGWETVNQEFVHSEEVCHRNPNCHNQCKLQIYKVGNETAIYGGECGMYESRSTAAKKTPELRQTQSGVSSCRFTVAVDRRFADKSTGERQADFITCTAWRQTAEFVSRYFNKGKIIALEGSLRTGKEITHTQIRRHETEQRQINIGLLS